MRGALRNPVFARLYAAQVLSLSGSGLTTIALGLLAFELAGGDAGVVLGAALALKMVAYVGVAPLAGALAAKVDRRRFLVALDMLRAALVGLLPFVTEVWQVYALVMAFQTCSAAFTPTFQATIPDVLPDEREYTRALSLSRLAYDLESLLSPLAAAALLTVIGFHWLFVFTAAGFLASAALVLSTRLPRAPDDAAPAPFRRRVTRGAWIYLATPRLRGLLALYGAVSAVSAMVIVNTVVRVKEGLGGDDRLVALHFAAYGLGSMAVALRLPALLERLDPRPVMLAGAAASTAALTLAATGPGVAAGLALWAAMGAAASAIQTPGALLLRRSCHASDRPALFAAQFALSHACWLAAYPAAGWLGARLGLDATFALMAVAAAGGGLLAARLWPRDDPASVPHRHPTATAHAPAATRHAHPFVIDDAHPRWPDRAAGAV